MRSTNSTTISRSSVSLHCCSAESVSRLQALRREPDADALRRARWDPLRLFLSFAIGASVLGLSLSRANTFKRGVGFAVSIGLAIGVLWLSAVGLSWLARRAIRPSW